MERVHACYRFLALATPNPLKGTTGFSKLLLDNPIRVSFFRDSDVLALSRIL